MNGNKKTRSRLLFGIPVLIFLVGVLVSILLFRSSGIGTYPALIADAYREEQHHLNVPGSVDVKLTRTGAYGIYYEHSLVSSIYPDIGMHPAIDCSLTSKSMDVVIEAVPDYVETNRYRSKDLHTGVLIMSITVNQPDSYTFACNYQDGRTEPEISVALGPNYFWEFLRIAAGIFVSSVVGLATLLGSTAIAVVVLILILIKRRHSSSLVLFVGLMFVVLSLSGCGSVRSGIGQRNIRPGPRCDSSPRGCTIFTVSHDDRVFFGGNGDWVNFDSNYYWVDPGSNNSYGAIYFGVPENVQQGFNEKGLAYDANGLPLAPVDTHPGRKPVFGGYASYIIQILQECATVEEVITWVQEHQWHEAMHDQMHFADASGEAVVISAGPDGKVAFTRKPPGDSFLVSTNFNLVNPSNGFSYPCWRYERAEELLKEMDSRDDLTAERAASILDAVHVESATTWTIMSVVGDLPQGLVYVYLFHQFDAPIVLNVAEEIANAPAPGPLRDLFSPETVRQADQAYEQLTARSVPCDALGYTWLGLVAVSLAALFFLGRSRRRQSLSLWVLVVAVLGPIGLVIWLSAKGGRRTNALVEAVCDLPPYVVGMIAALAMVIFVPGIGGNTLLQILAFYGLPLAIGLFLYQAPLLARATRSSYVSNVLHRLPTVLVSSNLSLAVLLAVYMPLIKWHLDYCGFSVPIILSWWAFAVLGAMMGGLLLYVYHNWAVRCGFAAWSALLSVNAETNEGTAIITSPSWRRIWLWIVLSFVVLVAGMALGTMGIALASGVS